MEFYKLIGKRGHQGRGRAIEVPIYIKARTWNHAIKKYNRLKGFHPTGLSRAKNHKGRYFERGANRGGFYPSGKELSKDEVKELGLERKINRFGIWVCDDV
jgi:hypothetical protein